MTGSATTSDSPAPKPGAPPTVRIAAVEFGFGGALWVQWAEVAVEQEDTARRGRADLVAKYTEGSDYRSGGNAEMLASMICIAAAAHTLDALYGRFRNTTVKDQGAKEAGREAHIRECLKRRFITGKRDRDWVAEFRWLFHLRDAAVHADPAYQRAVAYPAITGLLSSRPQADYCANNAVRAVDLMMNVLDTCVDKPKLGDADAQQWVKDSLIWLPALAKTLADSRTATPVTSITRRLT